MKRLQSDARKSTGPVTSSGRAIRGGQCCQSGCTDQKLDKDEGHEIKIEERNLNGRDVLVIASND